MAWRKLKRNHGREGPSQVISIGYSARQEGPSGELSLAGLHGIAERRRGGKWIAHDEISTVNTGDFWGWVRRRLAPKQPAWIFALDWSRGAILSGLWAEFECDRFRLGIPERRETLPDGSEKVTPEWHGFFCVESRPFVVFACCPRGVAKVVDVRNYLDLSEQELVTAADSSFVVESPWDRDATSHGWHAEELANATHRIMRGLVDKWSEHDRGNFQPTAGRMAMSNWRHVFMPEHGIQQDPDDTDKCFHRMGLYGGEVRAFRTGHIDGPIYHVDCRSLYAMVMQQGLFPWKVQESHPCGSILGGCVPEHPDECIATVVVHAGGNTPVRDTMGKVTYPTGRVITTLAGQELWECHNADMIEHWYAWERFALAPLFQHFAEYWLAVRRQAADTGDVIGGRLAKMLVNSLSGKFAGRTPLWVADHEFPAVVRWGNWIAPNPAGRGWTQWRAIAGSPQRMTSRAEKDDSFPAITAFITASGREYMRSVRGLLPDGSVICQQTDGWLLTKAGFDALRSTLYWGGDAAGQFRLISEHVYVDVFGPNHYRGDGLMCMSGLPEGSERIDTHRWIVRLPESTAEFVRRGGGTPKCKVTESEFRLSRDGGNTEFTIYQ